jgi:hypothetical protein
VVSRNIHYQVALTITDSFGNSYPGIDKLCAGISRHVAGEEEALQERSSEPS